MKRTILAGVAAGMLLPALGHAQARPAPDEASIDVQNFWPTAGPSHAVVLRSSDVQPHLSLGFGLVLNIMSRPLRFTEMATGQPSDAVLYALTTDFLWSLGLFDRIQISAAVPLVVAQEGAGLVPLVGRANASALPLTALRDARFEVSVAILRRAREVRSTGFGLRLDLGGSIPTGDRSGFQGASTATFTPMLVADYRIAGITATANLGARVRGRSSVADFAWGSQFYAGVGVAWRPNFHDRLNVGVDYQALVPLGDASDICRNVVTMGTTSCQPIRTIVPMELFVGARYAVDRARDIEIVAGGGIPLGGEPTNPAYRFMLGLSYAPRGNDSDRDGVLDGEDSCPAEQEDRDGHRDNDGCVDPDNDDDRIPDERDACRDAPEDVDNFRDEDGCPEPDNDEDGVPDTDDRCATEPAGERPDPDSAGCPVRDRDGDRVLDEVDRCPEEPRGDHEDPARRGCPLPDRDRDGVGDADDACPADPRGEHPDRFRGGCPDPDRDHDGVANEVDRCIDEPETLNGATDDDGCPDAGDENVTINGSAVLFRNVIALRPRTRALTSAQTALITQAAQRIRGRGAEVARVRVEVVAGARPAEAAEANRLAELVAAVLVAQGIPRESIATGPAPAPTPTPGRRPAPLAVGELRIRLERRAPVGVRARPSATNAASPGSTATPAGSTATPAGSTATPAGSTTAPAGSSPAPASGSAIPPAQNPGSAAPPAAPNAP